MENVRRKRKGFGETDRLSEVMLNKLEEGGRDIDVYADMLSSSTNETIQNRNWDNFKHYFLKDLQEFLNVHDDTETLENIIASLAHGSNVLNVLEVGAGSGRILMDIKEHVGDLGQNVYTTAIEVSQERAFAMDDTGSIDEIHMEPAEISELERKYNLIYDISGGITYANKSITKELILKYCHLLADGGVFAIHFAYSPSGNGFWYEFNSLFSDDKHSTNHNEQMDAIKQYLRKLGFRAEFFYNKKSMNEKDSIVRMQLLIQKTM